MVLRGLVESFMSMLFAGGGSRAITNMNLSRS